MNRKHNDNISTTLAEQSPKYDIENYNLNTINKDSSKILLIEPFYGGSHKQLIDVLMENIPHCNLISLSAKKWHWRARCSALILSKSIPEITCEQILFCSSVLNLCELIGLRPDLCKLKKIVYFHENQLVYPIRRIKERDVQYAYNQIITWYTLNAYIERYVKSCSSASYELKSHVTFLPDSGIIIEIYNKILVADLVVFNSSFNMQSFLTNIPVIMKLLPDNRPKNIKEDIKSKCMVLYFPMKFPTIVKASQDNNTLRIVWPHRWEFDKDPESFVKLLFKLKENCIKFKVSLLGQGYIDVPDIIVNAKEKLKNEILHFGYLESRNDYLHVLSESHIAVSTAKHEFFGVSMLEAVHCGCFPLVPNGLVYPEIYPSQCQYRNDTDLYEILARYCQNPERLIKARDELNINLYQYSIDHLLPKYMEIFDT